MSRLELQPDDPAAPPALDRGPEVADEVLGFLLDLDVAVADDAERAAAQHFIFGEQIIGLAADQGFERDVAALGPGMRMKRGRLAGAISSSRTRAALLELEDQAEPAVGNEREGVRGIDRLRGQDRKDLLAEMLVEPGLRVSSSGSSPTTCMPASSQRRLELAPRLRAGWSPGGRPRR